MEFLPVSIEEIKKSGAESVDFILVTGDAYVDHPSFGAAVIGRILQSGGFTVAVLPQPNWRNTESFRALGKPRLGFLVTGGNIDSMVNHYSVARKRRSTDQYSPGGQINLRPDRASIVYGNKIREAFGDIPIILGGLEASLRRLSHYDYWDNKVRRSILLDSSADILVYGMGESPVLEIAEGLAAGLPVSEITFVNGTVYKTHDKSRVYDAITLPHYKQTATDKKIYAESFLLQYENTDAITAKPLIEPYNDWLVVQNPPALPLESSQLDKVYALHYARSAHPMYNEQGGIPAISEVKFSIISNRGCFGNCNFCALTFHQGRIVQARSHASILREAEEMIWDADFKGYIHDVGGPTANFREPACAEQLTRGACLRKQCLFPKPCSMLRISHRDYLSLLRKLRALPKVKKVFIRSGIRFDYLMADKDPSFMDELCRYHVSGQLKVAPEHVSGKVLDKMGKPGITVFNQFKEKYESVNQKLGMKQYLVPYLMSSHPGSDLHAAIELAEYLRDTRIRPDQVQDFYPTPGTLSTCMYYTGVDPRTGENVHVPKTPHEKALQRALMQYYLPQNRMLVEEALKTAGREDLIGFSEKSLIRPRFQNKSANSTHNSIHKSTEQTEQRPRRAKKTIRNVHKKKNQ